MSSAPTARKSGVSSSFLPEEMNRHRITRKDEPTPDYPWGSERANPFGGGDEGEQESEREQECGHRSSAYLWPP